MGRTRARSTCFGLKAAWELLSPRRSGNVAKTAWSPRRNGNVAKAAWSQRRSGDLAKAAWDVLSC